MLILQDQLAFTFKRDHSNLPIGSVYIGELFIISFFFEANETVSYSEDWSQFARIAIKTSLIAIGFMFAYKLVAQYFLVLKCIPERTTSKEVIDIEKNNASRVVAGIIIALIWFSICLVTITYRSIDYNKIAIKKWLVTYCLCVLLELVLVEALKTLIKIVVNSLLLKLAFSSLMASSLWLIIGKIANYIYYYLT